MPDAFDFAIAKLEFDKIRERLLRYAVSDPGREVLRTLPVSTSLPAIRSELERVSDMKRLLEQEGSLPLEGIHPVAKSASRASIEGTTLLPRELAEIGATMRAARTLRSFMAKRKEEFSRVWDLAEPLTVDKVLEFNIEQAVDETGAVRATASRELQAIRRSIAERYEQLRRRLEQILRGVADLGFTQDEIITTREGRMVIPVKVEHKHHVPGFIHSASASGATVFIEPTETLELNNEIRSLQFQEQREVERILRALTVQVGASRGEILGNLELLAAVDALQARAKYSIEVLGVAPFVTEDGPVRLVQARHPLLLMHHGRSGTVPLDLSLGDTYTTLLISGPNAGGKTVAMKCVGLLCLMVQAGLHIPVEEDSAVRVFTGIYVEVGDDQSIESDLSTFSSHLQTLRQILEAADHRSLVLIDEIGSGTDPVEGGAIAAAALEALTHRKCCSIATTHQSSLKVFAHAAVGMENGAMEYDQTTLTPTYRFRSGIPGSSYALEMATRLGFPDPLMSRARELLGSQQSRLEGLLTDLEAAAQKHRADMEAMSLEKRRLDEMVTTYEGRISSLSREVRELKRKAIEEAEKIVADANAVIERSVREIRERSADRETVRTAHEAVTRVREELLLQRKDIAAPVEPPADADITVGSAVRLAGGSDIGELASLSPDGRNAVVVFGNVKMRVPFSELRAAAVGAARVPQPGPPLPQVSAARELDLRGMTGDEALPLVDKFIDSAILAGLHRVDIIHGKGTGALRKKVSDFLARHPRVSSFRLGEWNEGGAGATVVELGDK